MDKNNKQRWSEKKGEVQKELRVNKNWEVQGANGKIEVTPNLETILETIKAGVLEKKSAPIADQEKRK